jgi:2-amino-4-hydroxy-6-hydroxymethyldihydropteridine diphosphokinase
MTDNLALVALGSNQACGWGEPAACLDHAIAQIAAVVGVKVAVSRFYRTPAFPAGAGPDFVNAAISFACELPAADLLAVLHQIEAAAGRVRTRRWGQRVLDLDLIAVGGQVWPDLATQTAWRDLDADAQQSQAPDRLILPHPRLQDRGFVLVPLADIAPDWRHPILGISVAQMVAALPEADRCSVVALDQ